MVGYFGIVAVLLIYLHSINAHTTFDTNTSEINQHILREKSKRYLPNLSHYQDPFCGTFSEKQKQRVCGDIMKHLIEKEDSDVFQSFVGPASGFELPQLVNLFYDPVNSFYDLLTCRDIKIEGLDMIRGMFWCESKQYKTQSGNYDEIEGFFCAGALLCRGRAFVFRPTSTNSVLVKPVAEITYYHEIKDE